MRDESVGHKRLWAWIAVAMSAPLAHFCGGSWLALVITGGLCWGIIGLLPGSWDVMKSSRILCALELIWIVVLLSQLIPHSAAYWPGTKSEIVIPAVLLALSAYGCSKRASRVAGVLFWVLLIMYLPVAVAGAKDVELSWLMPKDLGISMWMIPILLLPCAAGVLGSKSEGTGWYPGILAFGIALWALTAGVLSPTAAANLETPFRELSRSLTIGAASRFESLLSVLVSLGWFGLSSLLVQCGSVLCEKLGIQYQYAPWVTAGAAFGLPYLKVSVSGRIAAIVTLIMWVLLPFLTRKKLSKKSEKSA